LLQILDPADVRRRALNNEKGNFVHLVRKEQGFDFRWLLAGRHWETASKMSLAVSEAI
jgi:hypothetical protein